MKIGDQQMPVREFAQMVWKYKRLPPLWMWNPPWFRRLVAVIVLPPWWALGTVLWMIVASIAWLVTDLRASLAAEWRCMRAVWNGRYPERDA